ncbi:hypothetical protein C8A01DRAFT_19321 [Parachaetomium inaequale]|uniref:Uncharacterized protein n=1 Tax=Parachaetomium inaequale TaxID=2588326 RepID=A0AAN6SN46_9PEZI|nr:hypothetical protein C8A01DRAFT_19321 [Parachaetomium inaequale]
MPLASTLPTGSKPALPATTTNITRVILSNGYRAYHPKTETDKPAKPKKTVRFVKGHTTIPDPVALSEAGSDSEIGDDFDFLHDFSLEEAEGWVPVMVAEEDEGDDWMSLTGSWIRLGDVGDAKK